MDDRVVAWLVLLGCVVSCPVGCSGGDKVGKDVPSTTGGGTKSGTGGASAATGGTRAANPSGGSGGATAAAGSGGARADAGAAGKGSATHGDAAIEAGAGAGGQSGAAGAQGGAGTKDAAAAGAADPECDLNGIWIARLTTFSRDTVFGAVQTASNWFYYEITQSGRDVRVSAAMDCGIQVSGSANVTITDATLKALLHPNDQTGRRGQFYKDGDHCSFALDRFYSTRGVPRDKYLPADTSSNPDLASITPALPTEQMPAGQEDWDGDGMPGIAFHADILGTRHVVQRDWNQFASNANHSIAFDADEFVAGGSFDNQEQILAVDGAGGDLLRAGSTPATGMDHRVHFKRLGKSASDPAVTAVHVADEVETCHNVQAALPHDSAMQ